MLWLFFIIALIKVDATEPQCPPTTEWIQGLLDEACIPGAAVIVVNPNEVIYQQGIGYHSPPISEQRQPIDPSSSIFVVGSISKPFIVVAAMQMVELNRLNLDTDINQYLPPFMNIVHPHYPNVAITTRHLLSHTSGIGPNPVQEYGHYLPGDSFTQTNLSDVIQTYVSDNTSWLPIPPGNKTFYSNIGTTLAAFIIEHLAEISFEQYVHDKILKPLGIDEKKAGYRLSNFQNNEKNLVDHYIYNVSWLETYQQRLPQLNMSRAGNSNWFYIPFFGLSIYPAGLLRMSAHSLSIFLQSFLNNFTTLLHNSSSIEEMLHVFPQESYNGSEREYSLIWNWQIFGGRRLVGHQGIIFGITSIMMANEERNLGVIVLANADATREDDQEKQVRETRIKLMNQLFDCFETPRNMGLDQRPNFIYILEIISILCFYLFNSSTMF